MKKEIEEALRYVKEEQKENTETEWTTREKLALASAVNETGEVYWPAISRLVQPFGAEIREKNWCTAKDCAKQYSMLIDSMERRKRNDSSFSSLPFKEQIVKKLTLDRIQELHDSLRKEQDKQNVLTSFLAQIESGELDDQVNEIWDSMKEDSEFCEYVTNERNLVENYSETTEAMKIDITQYHQDNQLITSQDSPIKPRLVLHLKKTSGDDDDDDDDDDNGHMSDDSRDSCFTEPAIFVEENTLGETDNLVAANPGWLKSSKMIINNVIDDPNSHLFDSVALCKKDLMYKMLLKSIRNPIDIRNDLRDNLYETPQQFQHDLLLMFLNALCYFPQHDPSYKIIKDLYEKISPLFKMLTNTQYSCLYDELEEKDNSECSRKRTTRLSVN